jgi:large conductance mechanosensitive channel
MRFVEEFKKFILRGSVVDLAVGVITGAAFGKIVTSLVADVFMPVLGLLVGGVDFRELKIELKAAAVDAAGASQPAVTLNYGNFIQTIVDFLIVGLCIFAVIKAFSALQLRKEKAPADPAPPPPPSATERLLTEIRDLLAKQ